MFEACILLDFVRLTTRTPHGSASYVRGAERSRIDPHWREIERLAARTSLWCLSDATGVLSDLCRLRLVPSMPSLDW